MCALGVCVGMGAAAATHKPRPPPPAPLQSARCLAPALRTSSGSVSSPGSTMMGAFMLRGGRRGRSGWTEGGVGGEAWEGWHSRQLPPLTRAQAGNRNGPGATAPRARA